jgi:hypothetical protein
VDHDPITLGERYATAFLGTLTPRAFADFFAMFARSIAQESDPRDWIRPFSVLVLFLIFVAGVFWIIAR